MSSDAQGSHRLLSLFPHIRCPLNRNQEKVPGKAADSGVYGAENSATTAIHGQSSVTVRRLSSFALG